MYPVALVHFTRRMLNVWRLASAAKMPTITWCIVNSATTLQWTVNPSYYLLEQVGGLLLDIANPRERFFFFICHFLKLNLRIYFMHFLRQKSLT